MSRKKRTRHNPLEENPVVPTQATEDEHAVAGIRRAAEISSLPSQIERIERLPPSQIFPDRFQPRRILPAEIRAPFFAGEIDCYRAAALWLELAGTDESWRTQIEELLAMGDSFEAHGQIKPITGTWAAAEGGEFLFQIETGERRFWAACLRAVQEDMQQEPSLRIEVVERPTRHRQVLENRHALAPSAVGQACEIAALMLEAMGIEPEPGVEDEYDYFRLALKSRAPRGFWADVQPVMQLSARRMQQLLAVLRLPTPLLELADRSQLPERVLREVLTLAQSDWEPAIWAAIEEGLSSEAVAEMAGRPRTEAPRARRDDARRAPDRIAFTGLRRFLRAAMLVNEGAQRERLLDQLADELAVEGLAAELEPLLLELAELLKVRRA